MSREASQRAGTSGSDDDSGASGTGADAYGLVNTARGLAKSYGERLGGCNVRKHECGESRELRGLLAVPAGLVLFASMAGLTPLYHHRTADSYWVFSGLVLWSGLCLTMMTDTVVISPLGSILVPDFVAV